MRIRRICFGVMLCVMLATLVYGKNALSEINGKIGYAAYQIADIKKQTVDDCKTTIDDWDKKQAGDAAQPYAEALLKCDFAKCDELALFSYKEGYEQLVKEAAGKRGVDESVIYNDFYEEFKTILQYINTPKDADTLRQDAQNVQLKKTEEKYGERYEVEIKTVYVTESVTNEEMTHAVDSAREHFDDLFDGTGSKNRQTAADKYLKDADVKAYKVDVPFTVKNSSGVQVDTGTLTVFVLKNKDGFLVVNYCPAA